MGCCFPTLAPNRARRWATLFRADRRKKADPSTSLRMTTVLGDRLLLSHSFANCAKGWGTHFRAARREGLALLAQGKRRTCGAGPSTALRFAQDDNRSWGWRVASHPFANCAKGWGTLFRACRCELQISRVQEKSAFSPREGAFSFRRIVAAFLRCPAMHFYVGMMAELPHERGQAEGKSGNQCGGKEVVAIERQAGG